MKNEILKRPRTTLTSAVRSLAPKATALLGALLFTVASSHAAPVLDTVTGGPSQFNPLPYGYEDGDTAALAQFYTPWGIALDSTGTKLFVADRDNHAIRLLYLGGNVTTTFTTELIDSPVGVAVDGARNVYVLNQGNGFNGSVLVFDEFGSLVQTKATDLVAASGLALDANSNVYVTVNQNQLIRITPANVVTTVATVPDAGTSLQGIVVTVGGFVAAADAGRHGVLLINPTTGAITNLTGFKGAGDRFGTRDNAQFNEPMGIAKAGGGLLVVSDFSNHRVKVVSPTGTVTNLYGVSSAFWYTGAGAYPGWWDGTVCTVDNFGCPEARQPVGVLVAGNGDVYSTEVFYHLIRKTSSTGLPPPPPPPPAAPTILSVATNIGQVILTWSAVPGATNYIVKRSPSSDGPYANIATTTTTSYTDTNVINGTTYYYVISASNAGGEGVNSAEVNATPPMPPVPDPEIGYVDFPATTYPLYTSVFHPVSSYDLYNDAIIVIKGTPGTGTHYEYGYTTNATLVPNPTPSSPSVLSDYQDGLSPGQLSPYTISQIAPSLTIKAMGEQSGRPNSAVVKATFQFKTGNPVINGDNAARFTISDITKDAHLYYTLDGSDPSSTNYALNGDLGTVATPTNVWTVGFSIQTNTVFKVRAFRDNYQPSAVVSTTFSPTNFNANKITFGFSAGEASSDFVASAGQFFYAPVTLSVLPETPIYSLQFNVTVTNLSGPAVPAGQLGFESMLVKPHPDDPGVFLRIPTAMFFGERIAQVNPDGTTNYVYIPIQSDPPDTNQLIRPWGYSPTMPFVGLTFSTNNLLGVGWLERRGKTNLYDTTVQDLIKYSLPHDTLFDEEDSKVVLGGYAFRVPGSAQSSDSYQIRIGLPSATSDGIGAPGSDVYIATPTNGSFGAGIVNAIKQVTIGQRKYLAGDSAPFRWFNAGDFGNTNLDNSDVMQVFQSAIYSLNYPPFGSDFFDAMDTCGYTYTSGAGYLVRDTNVTDVATLNGLFNGSDSFINYIAFGDDNLDVCDVYVTFRRSLDPGLTGFRRFWTNGVRGAETFPNVPPAAIPLPPPLNPNGIAPEVKFSAGDAVVGAGQTLSLPITAQIHGDYPLRLLALGLTVQPLDGSPAITSPVQFIPNSALGSPSISSPRGVANYSAVWLNKSVAGLTGDVQLGTLLVTLPAGASPNAAYAVNFDHASGSPNGLASFPRSVGTGLITLSDRSASSFNDGISDSWRLRHFATLNNILADADADADGDSANNWHEFKAGTNPNDAASLLKLRSAKGAAPSATVQWPSVLNKQYVIERAASLYSSEWTPVSTNNGTGWNMQYQDPAPGGVNFYRVRVQP